MRQPIGQFDRRLCGGEDDHAKGCSGSGTAEWVALSGPWFMDPAAWLNLPLPGDAAEHERLRQHIRDIFHHIQPLATARLLAHCFRLEPDLLCSPSAVVAGAMETTPRLLNQKLRQEGCSLRRAWLMARCEWACQLLCSNELDLPRLSQQLGFDQPAAFVHGVKSLYGMTPIMYWRSIGKGIASRRQLGQSISHFSAKLASPA